MPSDRSSILPPSLQSRARTTYPTDANLLLNIRLLGSDRHLVSVYVKTDLKGIRRLRNYKVIVKKKNIMSEKTDLPV